MKRVCGEDNVSISRAATASEDFAFFANEIPCFFFSLGGMTKGRDPKTVGPHHTPDFFIDESGLKLGISLEKIELKKGKSYLKQTKGREVIITYRINDMESSSFLQWYAMPGYFIEITLTDNKATKIFFGFDYP